MSGKPQKKLKKKEKLQMLEGIRSKRIQTSNPQPSKSIPESAVQGEDLKAADDDAVDIFGEAGSDYKCQSRKKSKEEKAKNGTKRSYFGNQEDDMMDLPPLPMERDGNAGLPDGQRIANVSIVMLGTGKHPSMEFK